MNHTESGKVAVGAPNSEARRKSEVEGLNPEEIRHIWIEVLQGRGRHGGFLMAIAAAVSHADPANTALMRPLLLQLIWKYELHRYMDTYKMDSGTYQQYTNGL